MVRLLRAITLAVALLVPSLVFAQSQSARGALTSTTCPGTSGCVSLSVSGVGGVAVQVTGTFVGTLTFEGSIDGVNYVALGLLPIADTTAVTSTTTTGLWSGGVGGMAIVRVRMSAYTSGTATVSIQNAPTSSRSSGGGGGGTPGGADTSIQFNDGGAFGGFGTWDLPGTLLTLDGNLAVYPSISGGEAYIDLSNLSATAGASQKIYSFTTGDAATGQSAIQIGVHGGGANEASLLISVAGDSGNATPITDIFSPSDINVFMGSGNGVNIYGESPGDSLGLLFQNTSTDAGSSASIRVVTTDDGATGSAGISFRVHQDGANDAEFSISVAGDSGDATPDTTFTFPGAALFTGADSYKFSGPTLSYVVADGTANGIAILAASSSNASGTDEDISFIATTTEDANTSSPHFDLEVHSEGTNQAKFKVSLDGTSGNNTPTLLFEIPGAAAFTGASAYTFEDGGLRITGSGSPSNPTGLNTPLWIERPDSVDYAIVVSNATAPAGSFFAAYVDDAGTTFLEAFDGTDNAGMSFDSTTAYMYVGATGEFTLTPTTATFTTSITFASASLPATTTTFTNGAGASAGTLTNAPAAGNPTKWIPIDDNGTTRYIPAW